MSKFGLYIAVTCARPNLPVQSTISEGVLEAYLAIARAPSETSGANYDSHGGHLVHSYLADMWRLRLSERFPTGAISSVNALDVPAERIIAEGRNRSRRSFVICGRVRSGSAGASRHCRIQGFSGICRNCHCIGRYTGLAISDAADRVAGSRSRHHLFINTERSGGDAG